MVDTTLEEARRCAKCDQPGEDGGTTRLTTPRGARLVTFICRNPRCKWFNSACRVVQINADGTIPPPLYEREKKFPKLDPVIAANVDRALQYQLEAEQQPGAEVRGR